MGRVRAARVTLTGPRGPQAIHTEAIGNNVSPRTDATQKSSCSPQRRTVASTGTDQNLTCWPEIAKPSFAAAPRC